MSDRLDLVFVLNTVEEFVGALGGHAEEPSDVEDRVRAFDKAALRVYLSSYCEENACESWNESHVAELWRRACNENDASQRVETCRILANRARGWWTWRRGDSAPEFVKMCEWERRTGRSMYG